MASKKVKSGPLEFDIEMDSLTESVDDMVATVDGLMQNQVYSEFVEWQEQDMKRKYPSITPEGLNSVHTMIYPRSRLSHRRKGAWRFARKGGRAKPKYGRRGRHFIPSKRPILRPILFKQLCDRMLKMLGEISWR